MTKHHEIVPNALDDYRELLENEYLGGWDLKRDGRFVEYTLTIASVEAFRPKVIRKKKDPVTGKLLNEPVRKFRILFVEAEKPWLAGPTSGQAIKSMYGPPRNWPGKRVTLYYDKNVTFGKVVTGGVRVRPTIPAGPAVEEMPSMPVDPEMRAKQHEAFGREPGSDDV